MVSNTRARSTPALDWLLAALGVLLMCGVLVDGWAHTHGEVDQSFLTPWHALLYGSMAVNGLALLATGVAGLRRGYSFRNALPPGYWTAALGVVLFLTAGAFDAWWHTAFGIENGIVLLVSPPHLLLAVAAVMIFSGPLQSVAARYGRSDGGWRRIGPAVLATWAIMTALGFFLAYAQPVEDGFTPLTMRSSADAAIYPMLYAMQPDGSVQRVAVAPKTDLATIAISPDGKRLAYRVNRYPLEDGLPPSDLFASDAGGRNARRITGSGRHDTQPAWSPDGAWIAYVSMPAETSGDFQLRLVSPDGKRERVLLSQATSIAGVSWSRDGRQLAFGSRNGTVAQIATIPAGGGSPHWLPFTAGGASPAFTNGGIAYVRADGTVVEHALDGDAMRVLVPRTDGDAALAPDGRHVAYVAPDLGSEQLWIAAPGGAHARDVSQLSGMDVQQFAWGPGGRIFFLAFGRSAPVQTDLGKSLAIAAILLQAVLVTGGVLLLLRRWNPPAGAFAALLTGFALAMAVQTDLYVYAAGAAVTGLGLDVAVLVFRDRVRDGYGFYAVGFLVPAISAALFEAITIQTGGGHSGWPWNLLLGAPMLAGVAGLFVAFCFALPIGTREVTSPAP